MRMDWFQYPLHGLLKVEVQLVRISSNRLRVGIKNTMCHAPKLRFNFFDKVPFDGMYILMCDLCSE